jgi:hypothetical protein
MKWTQGKGEDGQELGCWIEGEHFMLVPWPSEARARSARYHFEELLAGASPPATEEEAEGATEPPTTESLSASSF